MSEPARLRDEGPEHVRALLRAGAPTRSRTAEERARTTKRVARITSATVLATSVGWLPAAALGAGLGAAVVFGAWVAPRLSSPGPVAAPPAPAPARSEPAVSAAPPPAPAVPPDAPLPNATAAPPLPRPIPSAPTSGRQTAPSPAPDSLAEEAALLERARRALQTSPQEALAVTRMHAARFPGGALGVEREIIAIDALQRLGRLGEARARCEALLATSRGSLYEERARKLLEGMR